MLGLYGLGFEVKVLGLGDRVRLRTRFTGEISQCRSDIILSCGDLLNTCDVRSNVYFLQFIRL